MPNFEVSLKIICLPTSGVRVIIPLVYEKMKVNFENTGHGLIPTHLVRNSIADELAGKDAVMNFTLDLINQPTNRQTLVVEK